QGQADESVRYMSRGHGYQVFLTESEAALILQSAKSDSGKNPVIADGAPRMESFAERQANILRIRLDGAQMGKETAKQISAYDQLPTRSNYLIGNDSSQWRVNIPNYARVEYQDIYPGINLAFYGTQQALEYDFIVAPGADPNNITINIDGA